MNVEIFYHGVLNAHSQFGTIENDDMQRFYNNNDDIKSADVIYAVELGKINDNYCIYYSYLRYKNIVDVGGRKGSYFGLTIRCDEEYCQNVIDLYNLCDNIFKQDICNNILQVQNSSFKYRTGKFQDINKSFYDKINKRICDSIKHFSSRKISDDLIGTDNNIKIRRFNIEDIGSSLFWNYLKKSQKVYASPNFPTNEDLIRELSNKLEPEKNKNRQLLVQIEKLQNDIKSLKNQLSENEEKLRELSKNRKDSPQQPLDNDKINVTLSNLKRSLQEVLTYLKSNHIGESVKDKISRWIKHIIPITMFLLMIYIGYQQYIIHQQNIKLTKNQSEILQKIESLENVKSLLTEIPSSDDISSENLGQSLTKKDTLTINIKGFSGKGPLNKEKKYELSIANHNNLGNKAKWSVRGGSIVDDNKLIPSEGDVIISCILNDEKYVVKDRYIKCK